jgi:hypothetical protein
MVYERPVIARRVWVVMMIGIGVEFALGVACAVLIPLRRPGQWLPPQSRGLYVAHAVLGGLLAIAAPALVMAAFGASRFVRLGAWLGLSGLVLGAGGGMLTVSHAWRLTGMGLMFVGALVAFFGYIVPLADVPVPETAE